MSIIHVVTQEADSFLIVFSPWCVAVVRERHVSGAKLIEGPEDTEAARDGVAALDSDHCSDLAGGNRVLYFKSTMFYVPYSSSGIIYN